MTRVHTHVHTFTHMYKYGQYDQISPPCARSFLVGHPRLLKDYWLLILILQSNHSLYIVHTKKRNFFFFLSFLRGFEMYLRVECLLLLLFAINKKKIRNFICIKFPSVKYNFIAIFF
ncbi:hypothetical protein MEM_04519 [Candida albicans L26]|nr:hypothetical protein MEU_04547 [Candida albicans P37005]KGQ89748.1 hypothetical protein MG1_04542 [Candida albicans GC75]KGT65933.1 hypothetical protein MEK_04546 [Candida albicans 12C]KGU04656.1 hypothetical protein MEQ_04512 [Candida albicans P87]KGU05356.1 hypothetical protein MEY_04527 [Candida albicans 19F]KGU05830.1 hypothetical protein MEM_04519 [Candida albicans L26]KGU24952.1 hypothetical protein MGM_04557 [Candida albicans P75063]KHC34438.1 hypothetical protein W5O_04580 [Candid